MVRINSNGSIPSDNPFYSTLEGANCGWPIAEGVSSEPPFQSPIYA